MAGGHCMPLNVLLLHWMAWIGTISQRIAEQFIASCTVGFIASGLVCLFLKADHTRIIFPIRVNGFGYKNPFLFLPKMYELISKAIITSLEWMRGRAVHSFGIFGSSLSCVFAENILDCLSPHWHLDRAHTHTKTHTIRPEYITSHCLWVHSIFIRIF